MEFFLTKNQKVTFSTNSANFTFGNGATHRSTIANVSMSTTSSDNSSGQNVLQKLWSIMLESSESRKVVERPSINLGRSVVAESNLDWGVSVLVGLESNLRPNATRERRHFILLSDKLLPRDQAALRRSHQSRHAHLAPSSNKTPILTALQQAAKSLNYELKLKVTISNFNTHSAYGNQYSPYHGGQTLYFDNTSTLQTLESTIEEFCHITQGHTISNSGVEHSEEPGVRLFFSTLSDLIESSSSGAWTGNISITGILYSPHNPIPGSITRQDRRINKAILDEEIQTDVVLNVKGNIDVKCHRAFLCAHSSVFQAMFKNSYKESQTGTVDLSDMTESGVKAFLAYLYYADVNRANDSASIALELLKAGHKYDIPELEEYMRSILVAKDEGWFNVEVAMKLYRFSRKLDNGDELKVKAVSVMKAYNKELLQSKAYKKMFLEDPEATMELVQLAFSVC